MVRLKSPLRRDWIDPRACSVEYRLKIIGRLPFFGHLRIEAIKDINALFHEHDYRAGQTVYFEGDPGIHLYLVAMGRVKLFRNALSGQEILLDILHGAEYFGSLNTPGANTYTETAMAQTNCCLLQISSGDFETILKRYPDVTLRLLSVVEKRLKESREQVTQLSTFTAEQRIASTLLRLANKLGERRAANVLIQLPLSRQDLAAMTNTTTETASRVMSRFAEDGLIMSGRKWVAIADQNALEDIIRESTVN